MSHSAVGGHSPARITLQMEPNVLQFKKGAAVVVQGQPNAGYFYIVRKGTLAIDAEHRLGDKALSRFDAGDSFGLVSALTGHLFLVTIFALTEAEVLQIPVDHLGLFIKKNQALGIRLMSLYARELRAFTKHLARANDFEDRSFRPDKLFAQAKIYLEWKQPRLASYALHRFVEWGEKSGEANPAAVDAARTQLAGMQSSYAGPGWSGKSQALRAGEVIFLENEPGENVYVISKGRVKLFNIVRGHEYVLDILGEGEIFGEMAVLDKSPRMASAVTVAESEVLRLSPNVLMEEVGVAVMQKIFESLARRIWFSHQRLIILKLPKPIPRLYALLFNILRDQEIKKKMRQHNAPQEDIPVPVRFDELKMMCGILRIKDESIRSFLTDPNLTLGKEFIAVKSRKKLEEKIISIKTRTGDIGADLV